MTKRKNSTWAVPVLAGSIIVILLLPVRAHALSCASRQFTLQEAYAAAHSIIVGLVTECTQEISSDPWANGGSDCSFVSLEVLKDATPARDYSGVASSSGCGLSLHVGSQYLLFLDAQNRPMHFSAALSDDSAPLQLANSYVNILRAFRDGSVRHLSEPWVFRATDGGCGLSHKVGSYHIGFGSRSRDAPEAADANWVRETVDGETVYRARLSASSENSMVSAPATVTVTARELAQKLPGAQMFSVSFPEREPAPVRRATLSVGTRSWPLYRTETSIALQGMPPIIVIDYRTVGEAAEQILAAMAEPSDIVVSAVLMPGPDGETAPGQEASATVQDPAPGTHPDRAYFDPTLPDSSFGQATGRPNRATAKSRRAGSQPPEPVLRLETRSTHLPVVIEDYRACSEGSQR